ncbi:MAG TPA: sugar phosphate nucleotidyltransferase [Erysipelothrix sp.]
MDLTLVILAAGMGSRYGGLKQIDKFGLNGEAIIDFSIHDAIEAGFNKLVLIIRKEHEAIFEEELVAKLRPFIEVSYAFQDINDVPDWFTGVEGREKPWGTTHALLSARDTVTTPFAIINADDYYGKKAFVEMARFLTEEVNDDKAAMMGYEVEKTLTDHGTVTRGICTSDEAGYLREIVETDGIVRKGENVIIEGTDRIVPEGTLVSMNFWGFTPAIFDKIRVKFERFLKEDVESNPQKSEALLPNDVGSLIDDGVLNVRVLSTPDRWFGVTYQEDKPLVLETFANLQRNGTYPEKLWEK